MVRIVPNETIPVEVMPYLLPSEEQVITVRKHPAVLIPRAYPLLGVVTTFALCAADVVPGGTLALVILGMLIPPSCYLLYHSIVAWLRTFLVVTTSRFLFIKWWRNRQLTVIPISEADDMSFVRTLPGRLVGYGSFLLKRSGPRGRVLKITYLPYPEQVYLEVAGLIFPER
jgi:hypothetical protein